jgi:hypothetical protein
MSMLASITYIFAALAVLAPAASPVPTAGPSASPHEIRYVDFPARIDPFGTHKHVPLAVGSRVYFRPSVRVHEMSTGPDGRTFEQSETVDAASRVTRLANETLIVEPSGSEHHFAANAIVDPPDPSRNFTIIVIPPDKPVPAYLRGMKPDLEVR